MTHIKLISDTSHSQISMDTVQLNPLFFLEALLEEGRLALPHRDGGATSFRCQDTTSTRGPDTASTPGPPSAASPRRTWRRELIIAMT